MPTTSKKAVIKKKVKNPAPFSDEVLEVIDTVLPSPPARIWDPFAGTGKGVDHWRRKGYNAFGTEIEPEWASQSPHVLAASYEAYVIDTPICDVVCTSPTYGNRMADHHEAKDGSYRVSYRHFLGRMPSKGSSATMHWGKEYMGFHIRAWGKIITALEPGGLFVLNISDHIRGGEVQPVADWHDTVLTSLGLRREVPLEVETKRMRRGQNHEARVGNEWVLVYRKAQ